MKSITILSLLIVSSLAIAQTVVQDNFEAGATIGNDGRDGWRHNYNRSFPADNYTGPLTQGDRPSRVVWFDLNGNGVLQGQEAGAGSADWWIAPTKFLPNSGNILGLTQASFEFKIARNSPAQVTTSSTSAATTTVIQMRVYGIGSEYIERRWLNPAMPSGFWTSAFQNVFVPFTVDFLNPTGWTGVNGGTHSSVMSSASQIAIYYDIVSGSERQLLDDIKLTYNDGSGVQEVISNFSSPVQISNDGREGWKHNGILENPFTVGLGDSAGVVSWSLENMDSIDNGLLDTGVLLAFDPAGGSGDNFLAPARYLPFNGRIDMMSIGTLTFDYGRIAPTTAITTSNAGSLDAVIFVTADGYAARYRYTVADLNALTTWGAGANFYATTGLYRFWPISVDVNNKSRFVLTRPVNAPVKSLEEILANVIMVQIGGEIRSGSETNALDNVKLTYSERAKINGTLSFNDRMAKFPEGTIVQFLTPGTETVVYQAWAKRAANGTYVLPQAVPGGTFDLASDPGLSFMRRKLLNVSMSGTDINNVNFTFTNGDVDNSGEIDAADIDGVIVAFGTNDGDLATYVPAADVDGSGEVDAADIDIVISNFGAVND